MKYVNANMIFPEELVAQLQQYLPGGYVYIPEPKEKHKSWGELSGYRQELDRRNEKIRQEFSRGESLTHLAERYYLSVYAIRKIIYQK